MQSGVQSGVQVAFKWCASGVGMACIWLIATCFRAQISSKLTCELACLGSGTLGQLPRGHSSTTLACLTSHAFVPQFPAILTCGVACKRSGTFSHSTILTFIYSNKNNLNYRGPNDAHLTALKNLLLVFSNYI
ncbi:uncharacterized protein DS421_16g558940 [Arachis hypogaea]|nr:uncharacterized protein DS421_16g558940 [Arachis hypogaea]